MEPGNIWLLLLIAAVSFALSFIGAAVGLILGHLRLPLLIGYLHNPVAGAAMNSLISGTGALAGTVRHIREGRVSWAGLAMMGIPSVAGAIAAVNLIVHVKHFWSYLVIGIMLVISGVSLIRKKPTNPPPGEISLARRLAVEMVIGFGLGALGAITGLMLGSLRLPMMIKYLRMDAKKAVGTNMAVGCATGLTAAAAVFIKHPGHFNLLVLAVVATPTIVGGYLGGWLTGKLSKEAVQKFAGWIIASTGVYLIVQGSALTLRKKPVDVTTVLVTHPEHDEEWWWDEDDGSWGEDDDDMPEEDI
jgi:uncharacterized protein